MPRVRALAAAVAGIDRDQENTRQRSLLAQKDAKLMERPTAQSGRLLFPNRYPVVDALQLFPGDAALGALGLGNDLLQDAVIDVSSKASFFATELLELPSGAARALLLQFRAQRTSAIANIVDLASRQLLAIGGGGDGFDAEINPRKVLCHAWLRLRNIARRSRNSSQPKKGQGQRPPAVDSSLRSRRLPSQIGRSHRTLGEWQ